MSSDFDILKEAQRILTRLRLDTVALHLRMEQGVLHISGRFCHPYDINEAKDLNYEMLGEVDRQLRSLRDVKGVEYQLKNWVRHADGGWSKRKIRS